MTPIRAMLISTVLALVAMSGTASAAERLERIVMEDPRPADSLRTDRYTCAGEGDRATDVIVEYGATAVTPTEHRSRIHRMLIGGRELTVAELDRINAFASAGVVQGTSAGCSDTRIRVVIDVFDPDSIEPDESLSKAHFLVPIHLVRQTGELTLP